MAKTAEEKRQKSIENLAKARAKAAELRKIDPDRFKKGGRHKETASLKEAMDEFLRREDHYKLIAWMKKQFPGKFCDMLKAYFDAEVKKSVGEIEEGKTVVYTSMSFEEMFDGKKRGRPKGSKNTVHTPPAAKADTPGIGEKEVGADSGAQETGQDGLHGEPPDSECRTLQ